VTQDLERLELALARLRSLARSRRHARTGRLGWWVLALGESFAGLSFEERDAARARLCEAVALRGIHLPQCLWVWDETDRAQLVLATVPSRELAGLLAERLGGRGLTVRIRRELPEDATRVPEEGRKDDAEQD
jgi:hypothetical protein